MRRFKPLVTILLSAVFAMPLLVNAAEFTGTVVGTACAHQGKLCPIEGLEHHLAMEPDFVLVGSDGTYHYLHNLPRDTKVRHALKTVTIIGNVDDSSNAIYVNELSVDNKSVWSWEQQTKEGRPFFGLSNK